MPDNSLPKPVPPAGQKNPVYPKQTPGEEKTTSPVNESSPTLGQQAQDDQSSNQNDVALKNQQSQQNQPPQQNQVGSQQSAQAENLNSDQMPPSARVQASPPLSGQPTQKPLQPQQPTQQESSDQSNQSPQTAQTETKTKSSLAESPQFDNGDQKGDSKSNQAKFAKVKNSPFKYIPYAIGVLVLIGVGFFVWRRFFSQTTQSLPETKTESEQAVPAVRKQVPAEQLTLDYWGLWEPSNVMSEVIADFEAENEGVKINYTKQSHRDYRERLQTALSSGDGPDLFRYHASWVPMLREELSVMPQTIMTASEYRQTFYPVATEMLSLDGQLVGIPLMYEGLALYYNQEILNVANAEVPKSWAEVKTLANQLTIEQGGEIKKSGLAIGNASNVEHFSDIIALLMLQNGADLSNPTSQEAQDALVFYTNFIKQDQVWSDKLPSSTVAFARGDVAMMFAPSWRAHEIKQMNPELDFGIANLPDLGESRLAWANFWAEGVSDKSKNQEVAWKFLKYLSSREVQQKLYSEQSKIRTFGELYSRQDLASELVEDELVVAFLEDAPTAEGWYLSSYTHDNGINDLLIKHYEDAINAVLQGTSAEDALEVVAQGTRQILRQYGVGSTN